MCDTLCVRTGDAMLFAKNSDRHPDEAQVVEWHARRVAGASLRTQYLTIPDSGAHAFVGSRPTWLWGVEHGVNEHGVAIGNEKIWTVDHPREHPPALLGMDLVRLGLERARAMTETLKRLDLPGAVLNATGRVLSSNSLLDDMAGQFIPIAGGGLAFSHRPANDLFRKALLGLQHASDGGQCYSIPVPATENFAGCVAHLLPVRRQARDIFTGAANILVVTSVSSPMAPPAHILFGLFDLSPAEARVAQKIVQGSSVEEIATDHKISRETVRNQLKAVFAKTGTSRQAELVGLVMGTQIRAHGSS